MMHDDPRVDRLVREWMAGRVSRRTLARRAAALGVSWRSVSAAAGAGALVLPRGVRRAAAQERGGTVNVAGTQDSGIGNPILTGGLQAGGTFVFWCAFSRLVTYDDKGTPTPDLADSWEYNQDGTQLTLKLNPAATFHDGQPVTSADVLFTFDKIADPNTDTPQASRLQVGGEFAQWTAPDAQTVVLTTKTAYAPFLFALSQVGIIPKHILESVADINTDAFNTAPIGSGPFKVVEYKFDEYVRFEAHAGYHRGMPAADKLNVLKFEDTQPALAALEAGDVDLCFTPPESQPPYDENPDFILHRYVYYTPITLSFNQQVPALQDVKVREGIRHAINKDELAEIVTKGRNPRADNQYANGGPLDRYNDYNLPMDEFNLEAAGASLDQAGWVLNGGSIREKDGQPLSLTLTTYADFQEYINDLEILQDMLSKVGIEIKPEPVPDYDSLVALQQDPNADPNRRALTVEEWPHPFEQDPDVFQELHSSAVPPDGSNYNYFVDAELDGLLEQGRTTVDDEARIGIYHQIDARRKELIPSIPLYLATDGWVASAALKGIPEDTPSIRWYLRCCMDKIYKPE
jgi:peptide/nickel transport system substrate-binding protein